MTKFLGYLTELGFDELRGVGVARIDTLTIAAYQYKAGSHSRTVYAGVVSLYYAPVSAAYQYIGAQLCSTAYGRHIYIFAEDLLHCGPDIRGVLGLSVYYGMIFSDPEIYISVGCTIQYICVFIAIHRLQLLAPKPHTRIGIIGIQLVLTEDIGALLPSAAGQELGVLVVAAGDYPQGAHEHIQRATLAVSGHLVIWYDERAVTTPHRLTLELHQYGMCWHLYTVHFASVALSVVVLLIALVSRLRLCELIREHCNAIE